MAGLEQHFDDFFGFAEDYYYDQQLEIEENWEKGKHLTRDGTEMKIKDMTSDHITNTIRFFKLKGFDVRPLQKEYLRREKLIKQNNSKK